MKSKENLRLPKTIENIKIKKMKQCLSHTNAPVVTSTIERLIGSVF